MLLTQELVSFGLTDKEAEIYLANLQLGYATIQEVADKSNLNRTTVYPHIKNLIQRGLINAVEKNGRLFYVAERPEKLRYIHEINEKEMLNQLMPQLESLYNIAQDKPTVKYFDYNDEVGLRNLRHEVKLNLKKQAFNIFNYERYHEYINKQHIEEMLSGLDDYRAIYIASRKAVDIRLDSFMKNDKLKLKYLPVDKFGFLCEVLVSGDQVFISREKNSLLIKDNLFSQTLTLLFSALWGIAEDF